MEHNDTEPDIMKHAARWQSRIAASWLLLLGFVAQDVLTAAVTPLPRLIAIASLGAFAVVYGVLVLRYVDAGGVPTLRALVARLLLLAALVALTLALYLISVPRAMPPWIFVFAAIATGVTLPTKPALLAIAALIGFATAVGGSVVGLKVGLIPMVVGMGVVGGGAVATNRLVLTVRELHAARREIARLAVNEERLRFARDLHDLLGHSLSLIALKSELAGRLLPTAPERAAAEIGDVERVARDALREVREAVTGYRQPTLAAELRGAAAMLAAAGITADLDDPPAALPPPLAALFAWAVREGVTNVIRHSGARRCAVRIARADTTVALTVTDDGRGTGDDAAAGSGLAGLAERVAACGGTMEAGAAPQGGYRLRVVVPFAAPAARETASPRVAEVAR